MKKGLKIAAITVGVIIILMFLLPFGFQGKIADIVKTEGNKMLNAQFDFKNLNISLFRNFLGFCRSLKFSLWQKVLLVLNLPMTPYLNTNEKEV